MLRAQERQYASLLAHRKALERSEERFRDIAEVSSDWLWEVDSTGTLTYLSERFEQVTGFNRSEEHTSELQSLMRISYAVFCLKKKKTHKKMNEHNRTSKRT